MKLSPVHPGQILLHDFIEPMGITQAQLARAMKVRPMRISEIIHGQRAITADTALRLARVLNTSAEVWLGVQADYDLEVAQRREDAEIAGLQPLLAS